MKKFLVKFNALRGKDKLTIEADYYEKGPEYFSFHLNEDVDPEKKSNPVALIAIHSVHFILKDLKEPEG